MLAESQDKQADILILSSPEKTGRGTRPGAPHRQVQGDKKIATTMAAGHLFLTALPFRKANKKRGLPRPDKTVPRKMIEITGRTTCPILLSSRLGSLLPYNYVGRLDMMNRTGMLMASGTRHSCDDMCSPGTFTAVFGANNLQADPRVAKDNIKLVRQYPLAREAYWTLSVSLLSFRRPPARVVQSDLPDEKLSRNSYVSSRKNHQHPEEEEFRRWVPTSPGPLSSLCRAVVRHASAGSKVKGQDELAVWPCFNLTSTARIQTSENSPTENWPASNVLLEFYELVHKNKEVALGGGRVGMCTSIIAGGNGCFLTKLSGPIGTPPVRTVTPGGRPVGGSPSVSQVVLARSVSPARLFDNIPRCFRLPHDVPSLPASIMRKLGWLNSEVKHGLKNVSAPVHTWSGCYTRVDIPAHCLVVAWEMSRYDGLQSPNQRHGKPKRMHLAVKKRRAVSQQWSGLKSVTFSGNFRRVNLT
ncbi:hypothetical protein Bbelb_136180 [Branchiostoma belcheri]|nr:hypothetical protein Bbelb_136180 [Branchiostoma belcheri]